MTRHIIGIDVSKDSYDLFDSAKNSAAKLSGTSLDPWIKGCSGLAGTLVVFEATGVYSKRLARRLSEAGIAYAEVNPRHVRRYAQACGQLAKNDRIDAKLIASYAHACAVQPKATSAGNERVRSLVVRREQLVTLVTMEKGHLETCEDPALRQAIEGHIAILSAQCKMLEKQIKQAVEGDARASAMKSMPGVGDTVAASLIAYMPELGSLKRGQAAALAGLALYVRDSGLYKGKRSIYGGRAQLRRVLYMAALVAIRRNTVYQKAYQNLSGRGKPFKVAITAIMRKIIETLNTMCKNNTSWGQLR